VTVYTQIFNWSAKRAGATVTVYGQTREGSPIRVSHVESVYVDHATNQVLAQRTLAYGRTRYALAMAPCPLAPEPPHVG
jgi:hypothetical protein